MKSKVVLLSIAFLISFYGYSQSKFNDGFIITQEMDTLFGQLSHQNITSPGASCFLKSDGEVKTFNTADIQGFGYLAGQYFTAQVISNAFAEVLVIGEASLFKAGESYYLQKDEEVFVLESKQVTIEVDGVRKLKTTEKWRGILAYQLRDCVPPAAFQNMSLTEKSLTNQVVKYNKCLGVDFMEIKANRPWIAVNFGISAGVANTKFHIINNTRSPILGSGPQSVESYDHISNSYSSIDPRFGVIISLSFPRLTDRLKIVSEPYFISSSYSGTRDVYTDPVLRAYSTSIELNSVSVPTMLRYTLPTRFLNYSLQGGICNEFNFRSNTVKEGTATDTRSNSVTEIQRVDAFSVSKHQFGFVGGIVIEMPLKKFTPGISIQYQYLNFLDEEFRLVVDDSRVSFSLYFMWD